MRFFLAFLALAPTLLARPFTVVAYNVENLFDVDGIAVYEEYQSAAYTPAHLRTKLDHIAQVVARIATTAAARTSSSSRKSRRIARRSRGG